MDIFQQIIDTTLQSFDFGFCASVNIFTYLIIKTIDELNGVKEITIWTKRAILVGSIIILGIIYYLTGNDIKLIINSSILAPVFWSWIAKPILKKFNLDYNK